MPPVRVREPELREALSRVCPPVSGQLKPGERVIGGRVLYSAGWLGSRPFQPEPADPVEKPKEEKMDVTVKVSINTDDTLDQVSWKIADGVSDLVRSLDYETGPRGITAKATTPGSVVHLDVKDA